VLGGAAQLAEIAALAVFASILA
jgi:hypothetical protein